MTVLVTKRLHLAPVEDADAPALLALFNDADVGRYLLDGQRVTAAWVEQEIVASQERFAVGSAGLWAMRRRSGASEAPGRRIVGVVGYRPFFDPPQLQLLYALHPSVWGKGLATEAAAAGLAHGFEVLELDEVQAATDAPNQASIRVLERLGMSLWKTEPGEPWDTLFYRIHRQERGDERPERGGD